MLNIKLIAALVVSAAALGLWFYVKGLQTENGELAAGNAALTQQLNQQNAAIEALKKDADARLAAAQLEIEQARKETLAARKRAQDFFRSKPSTPSDLCKSALDLVNGAAQ